MLTRARTLIGVAGVAGSLALGGAPASASKAGDCRKAKATLKQAQKTGKAGPIARAQRIVRKVC